MRNKAVWAVGLVSVCALALVAASPAHPAPISAAAAMKPPAQVQVTDCPVMQEVAGTVSVGNLRLDNVRASCSERGGDVAADRGVEMLNDASLDEFIARNIRAAMELEAQAVAALQAALVREAAASAALLDARGDGTGGDPSHVHALNRLTQATQWARLAESNLARSLDDLAAALEVLPAASPVASIVLSPTPLYLASCNEVFDLTATALDMTGTAVAGESISFQFVDTGPGAVVGTFSPNPGLTDASGNVTTTMIINPATCVPNCTGGKDCSTQIRASDQDGLVLSNVVQIIDQIP